MGKIVDILSDLLLAITAVLILINILDIPAPKMGVQVIMRSLGL